MLRLYTDENVDGPIIEGIRRAEIDVLTLQEDGRAGLSPDSLVLDRATELGRVLFTQDADLLQEGQQRQAQGIFFAGVIFAPKNPARWRQYIEELVLVAQAETAEEYHNRVEYLPLKGRRG